MLALAQEQRNLSEKLIRLHVVANSDSAHDQAIKLKVRDAVLKTANELLSASDDAEQTLQDNLQKIADAACGELHRQNCFLPVSVSYQNERFPTREYETFSLPAGVYKTLRVNIGRAEGHNWWCVVYPSLCLSASMDELEKAAAASDFSDGEIRLITEADAQYRFRFKTIEILQSVKERLFAS